MPMRHVLSKISITAVLGLAVTTVLAAPAQAQEQWTPPVLELDSATCSPSGAWELEWSLTDTTDTVNTPDDYTYTVAEILTQIGTDDFGPWEGAALEGSLQVGAVLPRTGDGSLTGIQTLPGDTERVKLKAQSDRAVAVTDGRKKEGRGMKNALQHAVELGDCAAPAPPVIDELPQPDFGVGIILDDEIDPEPQDEDVDAEWVVDIGVPPGVEDTSVEYEIAVVTNPGTGTGAGTASFPAVEVGEVGVGDTTVRIAVAGEVQEPEEVFLELSVEDSAPPMLLEVELPALDIAADPDPAPSADPVADADQAPDPTADPGADPDTAQPALPTTGMPTGILVGIAAVLLAAGVLAVKRGMARDRRT
jgi:hypothetical protein